MFKTKQLHHALVVVSDREKARNFYGRILGLRELQKPDGTRPGLWYGIGNNELRISVSGELPPSPKNGISIPRQGEGKGGT